MTGFDIASASIEEAGAALRDGTVDAVALAEQAIARHQRFGEALMAYKTWQPERFRADAAVARDALAAGIDLGPLQGIPVSVKDIYGVSGYPTFAGCSRPLPDAWTREGPVVRALRGQLAPVTGKTHTVQFAFGSMGTNPHWGAPRNPWDAGDHRAPGGSSSGAGLTLWEGSAMLALGTDTAGSVRMPASFNGTVGVKTTHGRWSADCIVPLAASLDTAGILARSVADAAVGFSLIDPEASRDAARLRTAVERAEARDFRVGVCDWCFEDCDPGIADGVRAAIAELEKAGLRVETIDLPLYVEAFDIFRDGGLSAFELPPFLDAHLPEFRSDLDPNIAVRFAEAEKAPMGVYLGRLHRLAEMTRAAVAAVAGVDAVLGPTMVLTPPRIADLADPKVHLDASLRGPRNTVPVNLLTQCAVTVPVALDAAGMPVGLQIACPGGEDARALAIARAFEKVLGTARERLGPPPLCRD